MYRVASSEKHVLLNTFRSAAVESKYFHVFSLGLQVDSSYQVLSYFLYPAKEIGSQGGR